MRILLIITLLCCTGCGVLHPTRTVLHPIDKQDIAVMEKDEPYTPDRDGYFMSKMYLEKVVDAKAEY